MDRLVEQEQLMRRFIIVIDGHNGMYLPHLTTGKWTICKTPSVTALCAIAVWNISECTRPVKLTGPSSRILNMSGCGSCPCVGWSEFKQTYTQITKLTEKPQRINRYTEFNQKVSSVQGDTSNLIHLFACLSVTRWFRDSKLMCFPSKDALQQLLCATSLYRILLRSATTIWVTADWLDVTIARGGYRVDRMDKAPRSKRRV
jgi:hypothetical protein